MKTIIALFVAVLLSTQIVKSENIKDATLKEKGTQNEASTIAWLQAINPDANLITMGVRDFNRGFKQCLIEYNQKYQTFTAITPDVINNDIIPKLYTQDLVEGRLYTFSYWNVTTQSWGRWTRMAKKGETGLFFPGWGDDPIMSVYCWNFGYPTDKPVIVPVNTETVVKIIPGINTYTYRTDTIRERYDNYREIENNNYVVKNNNNFTKITNQSFTAENNTIARNTSNKQNDCGCDEERICRKHYDDVPKEKKKILDTRVGKVGLFLLGYGAGYLTKYLIDKNNPNVVYRDRRILEQAPLETLPVARIVTQAKLDMIN